MPRTAPHHPRNPPHGRRRYKKCRIWDEFGGCLGRVSDDGLHRLTQGLDVELLEGDGVGVEEVLQVVVVGLLVVGGGFFEEGGGELDEELVGGGATGCVVVELFGGEVFGYFFELVVGQVAVGVEVAEELRVVDPGGDGGFKEGDVFLLLVGVVA